MSKSKKIILGIATIWPSFYFFVVFSFLVSDTFFSFFANPELAFKFAFGGQVFTMIWIAVLLYLYIRNVFKNPNVPSDKKALWAVVLFLGHLISMPIYWYLYIWKEKHE